MTLQMLQQPAPPMEVVPFVLTTDQQEELEFHVRRQARADARRFRSRVGYHGAAESIDSLALSAIELALRNEGIGAIEPNDEQALFMEYLSTFTAEVAR